MGGAPRNVGVKVDEGQQAASTASGRLYSSRRYAMDRYGRPVRSVRPISQVRLVDTPEPQDCGSCAGKLRSECALSAGTLKPASPPKPQQLMPVGSITCPLQARTTWRSL